MKFEMCSGGDCESEENIRKWLANKYIVLLYNQVRFDNDKYHEEARIAEARIVYIPISS